MNCEYKSILSGNTLTITDIEDLRYVDRIAEKPPYTKYLKITGYAIVSNPMDYQVDRNDRAYRQQASREYGMREYTWLAKIIESAIDDLGYLGSCMLMGNAILFEAIAEFVD